MLQQFLSLRQIQLQSLESVSELSASRMLAVLCGSLVCSLYIMSKKSCDRRIFQLSIMAIAMRPLSIPVAVLIRKKQASDPEASQDRHPQSYLSMHMTRVQVDLIASSKRLTGLLE